MENFENHSYWCTWLTQNYLAEQSGSEQREKGSLVGDQGAKLARKMLTEERIFGKNGWAEQFGEVKKDLYLLLDDGWDVPTDVAPDTDIEAFGSLDVSKERFPSFGRLSSAEKLKKLAERVKSCGWKGLGIWVAAQCGGEAYALPFGEEVKNYWRERILQSKYAGVSYWKVDWGRLSGYGEFRRFLTEEAKKLYPQLIVEHISGAPPLNGVEETENETFRGRYAGDKASYEGAKDALSYCDVFRTYDVIAPLSVAATLDRLAVLLPLSKKYLNAEDELYIAAALGCQAGVMRSVYGANMKGSTEFNGKITDAGTECDRIDEVYATVFWQRRTPPFFGGVCTVSEEVLFDDYTFEDKETWYARAHGKRICQGAPSAISRNAPLPVVCAGKGGIKPFVVASMHPNGNFSVAVLPRTVAGKYGFVGGEVAFFLDETPKEIAVFGEAERLTFSFKNGAKPKKIVAQSMLGGDEENLFANAEGTVEMRRDTIRRLWKPSDKSLPAVLLRIDYE